MTSDAMWDKTTVPGWRTPPSNYYGSCAYPVTLRLAGPHPESVIPLTTTCTPSRAPFNLPVKRAGTGYKNIVTILFHHFLFYRVLPSRMTLNYCPESLRNLPALITELTICQFRRWFNLHLIMCHAVDESERYDLKLSLIIAGSLIS